MVIERIVEISARYPIIRSGPIHSQEDDINNFIFGLLFRYAEHL